jgi:hypothetical protein
MRSQGLQATVRASIACVILVSVPVLAGTTTVGSQTSGESVTTAVTSSVEPGVTLTQDSIRPWGSPPAVANASGILSQTSTYVNVSIMGWGTLNPEPSPGMFEWSRLDQRIAPIEASGAIPVITLAGAPDWMKGGAVGTTDWSDLNVAPTPNHYEDFAQLAVAVARRYPQVHYFQVWNELKGFWDSATNQWDIGAYTTFYNTVYEALKSYNPAIQVGGPYVRIETWASSSAGGYPSSLIGPWGTVDQRSLNAISYWLAHADGADFLAVDGSTLTQDDQPLNDPFAATQMFAAVDNWLRQRTTLPIWWSEFYATTPKPAPESEWAAMSAEALIEIATSGAQVALMWDPEQYSGSATPGLWTSTGQSSGGRPTPLVPAFDALQQYFSPGTKAKLLTSGSGVVELTSGSNFLAVNTLDRPSTVSTPTGQIALGPWQIAAS